MTPQDEVLNELIRIGIALTEERDLPTLLQRILTETRRFTKAEAGTLFLQEEERLHCAVIQNDVLTNRFGKDELQRRFHSVSLSLDKKSLVGYVATTGEIVNLPDAYAIPPDRPYGFYQAFDEANDYRTRSVLCLPLQLPSNSVIGVLQLLNALDKNDNVIPFASEHELLARALASHAAIAIRNAQLEKFHWKDELTGIYNRRYFVARLDEEAKRYARSKQPMSAVFVDLDCFKNINDRGGHTAGDETLKEISNLFVDNSRDFTVICRFGGDEFAMLLVDTRRADALSYSERVRKAVEDYAFKHGPLTISVGVACLPDDVCSAEELLSAADKALYEAKRQGRNKVVAF
jgi:diguanylate cyclase (GGDEF)-like protein